MKNFVASAKFWLKKIDVKEKKLVIMKNLWLHWYVSDESTPTANGGEIPWLKRRNQQRNPQLKLSLERKNLRPRRSKFLG